MRKIKKLKKTKMFCYISNWSRLVTFLQFARMSEADNEDDEAIIIDDEQDGPIPV